MSGAVRAVCGATVAAGLLVCAAWGAGAEPPALNPFGAAGETVRDDAVPGYLELSDGTIRVGQIYLTRDAKLKVFDDAQKRQREVPLSVIQRVDCRVDREWLEKEWRFKENANDEKVYTGRNYPAQGVSSHHHTARRPSAERAAVGLGLRESRRRRRGGKVSLA